MTVRMSATPPAAILDRMNITVQTVPDPHPVDTAWVDEALATTATAEAIIGRPVGGGDGIMIAAAGEGLFEIVEARRGKGPAPARYMQVVAFDGPRTAQWAAAEERAATRLWPAVRDVPGIVWTVRLRAAGNAVTIVTLAGSADAIDAAVRAVMSTPLLPGEDPALLTGPDRIGVYHLVHADLPLTPVGSPA
ncbi:hypothetical protein [Dactylosporangium sp. NPDC006015]|uniref:hypothetical protein n=1 Tax=Dactylosporangium sp. NPDC006015 TaxID=3154576 RepID=UPI0033A88383